MAATNMFKRVSIPGAFIAILSAVAHGQSPDLEQQIRLVVQQSVSVVGVTATPSTEPPYRAVYQYGLASIVVGTSSRGAPVGYRLEMLVLAPSNITDAGETTVRHAAPGIAEAVATRLSSDFDALPGIEDPAATEVMPDEDIGKHFGDFAASTSSAVRDRLIAAISDFNQHFRSALPNEADALRFGIALRPCADPACPLADFYNRPRNRSTDRFGKVYSWIHSHGLNLTNQSYIVGTDGTLSPATARLDKGYDWHADFAQPVLQSALINAAKQARRSHGWLAYTAAELAGLSREETAHIADVFDSSLAAGIHLRSDPALVLSEISDELGRLRLSECVRLRGTFDPVEAGACAGYRVTQADIANCLSGRECAPPFGNKVNLDSLTFVATYSSVATLSQGASLPRVDLGTLDDVAAAAGKCSAAGPDAGYCLVKASLSRNSNTAQTLDCVEAARGNGTRGLVNCAAKALSPEQQTQIACFQNHSRDYKDLAICATADSLPPQARKFVMCANESSNANVSFAAGAACLGAAAGSREAACLAAHPEDLQGAALCMGGDQIPPQVRSAVQCAEKSESLSDFGVCMVANQGSGEAQRIAACYAETQGMPAALAICLAGQNLTQDQRIVLECAAQTSGAVPATAVCVGGKMAMREMMNCQGKKFGEDKCFGDGNEIRKFTKALGFEIGPHSMVADVINVQLQLSNATVTPLLQAGTDVVAGAIKIANDNGLIPDPDHPLTFVPGVSIVANYCEHNPCPKLADLGVPDVPQELERRTNNAKDRLSKPLEKPGKTVECVVTFGNSCN